MIPNLCNLDKRAQRSNNIGVVLQGPVETVCSVCTLNVDLFDADRPCAIFDECRHVFHVNCIYPYICASMTLSCPRCQDPINESDSEYIQMAYGEKCDEIPNQNAVHEMEDNEMHEEPASPASLRYMIKRENGISEYYANGRLTSIRYPNEYYTDHLEGPLGDEYVSERHYDTGHVQFFDKDDRLLREKWHDGNEIYYEGDANEERIVKKIFPDGTVNIYRGPPGQEEIVLVSKRE